MNKSLRNTVLCMFTLMPFYAAAQMETTAEVQIAVKDFMEISTARHAGVIVNIPFNTTADFTQGVVKTMPSALVLSSTIEYNVLVRAAAEHFRSLTNNRNMIPASVLRLAVENSEVLKPGVMLRSVNYLATTNQPLLLNGRAAVNNVLNITYTIPADRAMKYVLPSGAGLYTNTIIYTITPK